MFSLTEWIMKGAVCYAAAFRGAWIPDAEELWGGKGARVCRGIVVFWVCVSSIT